MLHLKFKMTKLLIFFYILKYRLRFTPNENSQDMPYGICPIESYWAYLVLL